MDSRLSLPWALLQFLVKELRFSKLFDRAKKKKKVIMANTIWYYLYVESKI